MRGPNRAIVASATDLSTWGINLGLFYICAYAYEDLSFALLLTEGVYSHLYDIYDGEQYTFNVYNSNY
jgi:hypothetical protein